MGLKLDQLIETQQLARKLLDEHGLHDWTFKFANDKVTVGWCRYREKRIEVSKHYLDSHPEEIRDTILHEIAHALVPPNNGHNHVWRMKAIEVGANPTRCTDEAKTVYSGNYNYTATCLDCGWTEGKHRLKNGYMRYHCKRCKGPITVVDLRTGDIFKTKPSGRYNGR